ncbi:protein NOI4 [Daucus carota subsp. sativus]|uniref:protein NOI4 n=1 Tax=Daucus carota subsp. sativus TaxID=79200 RepID=UPI0007EF4D52|nr:PREDICTED: uncharacterized protein LOC108220383 [Daucus carota subsp. sativus]
MIIQEKEYYIISLSFCLVYLPDSNYQYLSRFMSDKGRPLPKFGEWDVNDPASAEGFTVIFNKARDEKKTGGKPESPSKADPNIKYAVDHVKPQAKKWFCCGNGSLEES